MTTTGGLYGLVVPGGLLARLWLRGRVERRTDRPLSTEPMLPMASSPEASRDVVDRRGREAVDGRDRRHPEVLGDQPVLGLHVVGSPSAPAWSRAGWSMRRGEVAR